MVKVKLKSLEAFQEVQRQKALIIMYIEGLLNQEMFIVRKLLFPYVLLTCVQFSKQGRKESQPETIKMACLHYLMNSKEINAFDR